MRSDLTCSHFHQHLHVSPSRTATMCSSMQGAMEELIKVFHRYSAKEGDKYKLNKKELKILLQEELSDFLACSNDPRVVEKIMADLDENRDGEVDFQEFVVLVVALTVACNEYFVDAHKGKSKGGLA